MTNLGQFDPAYPPKVRNDGVECPTFNGAYANHMADYDTVVCDSNSVYYTWADNRNVSWDLPVGRSQADIRFVIIPWPTE